MRTLIPTLRHVPPTPPDPRHATRPGRHIKFIIRVTADELTLFRQAAILRGLNMSAWARSVLLQVARKIVASEPPPPEQKT